MDSKKEKKVTKKRKKVVVIVSTFFRTRQQSFNLKSAICHIFRPFVVSGNNSILDEIIQHENKKDHMENSLVWFCADVYMFNECAGAVSR